MDKEDFIKKIQGFNSVIDDAEKAKEALKKAYMEENCPYKPGDKVKVTRIEHNHWDDSEKEVESFGFVERIVVWEDGSFIPDCAACKKDGTKHARNKLYISIYSLKSIEKV